MTENNIKLPPYLFEVSWEVCNKVGGIHTVIASKILSIQQQFKQNYILIGPDIWRNKTPNPEFSEDPYLFKSWQNQLQQEGLQVKIGHWNVTGSPIALLVDFSPFIAQKDQILTSFWDQFRVDSLSGQWDYIEPFLFGFAAGKVIESFVHFHAITRHPLIAQFHEWMTGSGLLYLEQHVPQIGRVFTTHATVLGRCIAGNGLRLYEHLQQYNPMEVAHRFNIVAKQSLESKAAEHADSFTTVSEITAQECQYFLGKKVDMVTPNGFENNLVPENNNYTEQRQQSKKLLLDIARTYTGQEIAEDAFMVGISGRYEFRNKGIDIFIDALGQLKENNSSKRDILAFFFIPAGHQPRRPQLPSCTTHELSDPAQDPILNRLKERHLLDEHSPLKIIYCPSYLNGSDGVFNQPYYNILCGLDLTVFPSYYEPWGYTPLESLAFKIPTITTSLTGFGLWVDTHYSKKHPGIKVIPRNDNNQEEVVTAIKEGIEQIASLSLEQYTQVQENAREISQIALWEKLVSYYQEAYRTALHKVKERVKDMPASRNITWTYIEKKNATNKPNWQSIIIHRSIPKKLQALEELSENLWWCWHEEASRLFKNIDLPRWQAVKHNPIELLNQISLERYKELENDQNFINSLQFVHGRFKKYMESKKNMSKPSIAYFSMEYGLHSSLKIYSGGLGVLAGDYLKEASDTCTHITGIGLLYRYGYFTQKFSATGNQEAFYEAQDFSKLPITPVKNKDGNWLTLTLAFPGRNVHVRVWRVDVGRIELYLLDTDFEENREEDRSITHYLYGGDWENRLKQEILLGCGGIQALQLLGIQADIYHYNEGHAAFAALERLKGYVENEHLSFFEALEVVKASSLFTTHTPVPAGHDTFSEDFMRKYFSHFQDSLKITWEQFMALGRINNDPNEKFSMSFLAANLSQEINGVSQLHGKVSREIFKDLWPGYLPEELHIGYVTNGVHYPTWTAPEWKAIEAPLFGDAFQNHHYDTSCFENIYKVSDQTINDVRNILRQRLIRHVKSRLADEKSTAYFTPRELVKIQDKLRDNILTFGFARRFATYKRAHLLFTNLERLDKIVNNPDRPVQFIFAGKAHPADQAGQDLIKRIVEISKYPQFLGKIIFLPNYDMEVARHMIQGVDVWMNTPTRLQEASGTSGEKAVMNGVLHFSVLDGWWVEGYQKDAGWAIPMEAAYQRTDFQNELDAELIYNLIEDEIAPAFYEKNSSEISSRWAGYIKNTIAKVACHFTTNRMLNDYLQKFYTPMAQRFASLCNNHFEQAIQLAEWKNKINREWENIHKTNMIIPQMNFITIGKSYHGQIELEIGELSIEDVGVELVIYRKKDGNTEIMTHEFIPQSFENGKATYSLDVIAKDPGIFQVGLRVFPKNPLLPHRQDFALVKWL